MPKYILNNGDAYNFYTTIADGACYESALTLEQLTKIIKEELGNEGLRELPSRIERARQFGCSGGMLLKDCIADNRAGPDESHLTFNEFVEKYLTLRT